MEQLRPDVPSGRHPAVQGQGSPGSGRALAAGIGGHERRAEGAAAGHGSAALPGARQRPHVRLPPLRGEQRHRRAGVRQCAAWSELLGAGVGARGEGRALPALPGRADSRLEVADRDLDALGHLPDHEPARAGQPALVRGRRTRRPGAHRWAQGRAGADQEVRRALRAGLSVESPK